MNKKTVVNLLIIMFLLFSTILTYPAQAARNGGVFNTPTPLSSLTNMLPPFDPHQPMMDPSKAIQPTLPITVPEVPNNQISPRQDPERNPATTPQVEYPVNVETGYLEISEKDIEVPGEGLKLSFSRNYSSANDKVGPFGLGWETKLDSSLQMFADFEMGEERQDGTIMNYRFVKDDPDGFITEYDNDTMTNYELHKGHYTKAENGDVLTRIGQFEYVVETPEKNKITYYGYSAPWRENQPTKMGKMIQQTDRLGNRLTYDYNSSGKISKITDEKGRVTEIEWQGELVSQLASPNYDKISFS
ncbi:RHS repeat domain-containing protein [Paenisporosarcina cavernae]|uniref:DUF6531 domain-containing protein n=1 Tax=Paenisporosarcina cavernae TaxID=2320858 RepID=A0A385YWV1_9BACL|nr:RHS repeat domain-containing protein [Paenisporosarcina cavernae]AYC29992.1 hypothetical protein D3873_08955 [Paenisporosarcina cavernae]